MKKLSRSMRTTAVAALAVIGLGAGVAIANPLTPVGDAIGEGVGALTDATGSTGSGSKQLVAFGDSFTANAGKNGEWQLEDGQTAWTINCSTSVDSWPKTAGKKLNKTVGDWSCNGTGGMPIVQLQAYVESAIAYGDIGPGTEDVVLMYGGMDAAQWIDSAGFVGGPNVPTTENYVNIIADVKQRVQNAAPGATVTLLSYPEYASQDEQLCLVNFDGMVNPIPTPGSNGIQEGFRNNIQHAAAATGSNFIDVYEASKGHGTCNPSNEDRWVVGFQDPAMGPMTNHPSVNGMIAMGNIVADNLK